MGRDELQQRKYAHNYCKTCQSKNADMMFTGVPSEELEVIATTVLGDLYRQFIEDERRTDSFGIFHDDEFLTMQAACDMAHGMVSAGKLDEAISLYKEVLEATPAHGEANFQLGYIAEKKGERETALDRYETAVALVQDNANYQFYLGRLLRLMGRTEKSDAHLDSAVKLNPAMVDEAGALREGLGR